MRDVLIVPDGWLLGEEFKAKLYTGIKSSESPIKFLYGVISVKKSTGFSCCISLPSANTLNDLIVCICPWGINSPDEKELL